MPLNDMTQAQLNKLIALSEKERLEQITKVANKISKLVGKSFKDVSALLQYARLINGRSLDPLTKKKVEKLADELFDRVRIEITGGISGALKQSEKLSNHIESQITGVKPKHHAQQAPTQNQTHHTQPPHDQVTV